MTQATLLVLLTDCVALLQKANELGLELSEQVQAVLRDKIGEAKPGETFYVSNLLKWLPVPNTVEIHAGKWTGKIEAVKQYKNRTGLSLMDSKRAIEEFFEMKGLPFYHR